MVNCVPVRNEHYLVVRDSFGYVVFPFHNLEHPALVFVHNLVRPS
jgi:hypothetical protein